MSNNFNSSVGTVRSPYDTPDKIAGPKEIEGDLTVGGELTVGSDLTITGCLNNLQLYISNENFTPPTEEIYEQYKLGVYRTQVLAIQQELVINMSTVIPGTEADSGSNVYGYNTNQTLDLVGGKAKSYNPGFTQFNLKYHGIRDCVVSPTTLKTIFDRTISFYNQRGFQLQRSDVAESYRGEYILTTTAGQTQTPFVYMKFFYGSFPSTIPTALDLYATSSPYGTNIADLYEPNFALRRNKHAYPIRIPVTTDFCRVFQPSYNTAPIVYYDDHRRRITIRVPKNSEGYKLLDFSIIIPPRPSANQVGSDSLISFDGSFNLMKRDYSNQLVSSNPTSCTYLVQSSSTVNVVSRLVFNGITYPDFNSSIEYNYYPGGIYGGAVCPLMNGESSSFDCYIHDSDDVNAFSAPIDPLQSPAQGPYAEGDSIGTTLIESYSVPNNITLFTNPVANEFLVNLPINILKGVIPTTYPEIVGATAVPTFATTEEIYRFFSCHEMAHQCQFTVGSLRLMPAEAMAVGIELDTAIAGTTFSPYRALTFSEALVNLTRARVTVVNSDYNGSGLDTYGIGLFYKYMSTQFDTNHQVTRRTGDILSRETAGPLFKSMDYPSMRVAFVVNHTGCGLALNQALGELFGKTLADVFTDFSVSLVLLRNNTAIPVQYRTSFPYWLYNTQYAGYSTYPGIFATLAQFGLPQFANWWQMAETNQTIPSSWFNVSSTLYGQTIIRTLPSSTTVSVRAMSCLSYNVPHTTNTITVNALLGTWRVIVVQFTSDGGSVGSWIQDGVHIVSTPGNHVFNIASHVPAYSLAGNIRLVCVCVDLPDLGGLNNYFSTVGAAGAINITRN